MIPKLLSVLVTLVLLSVPLSAQEPELQLEEAQKLADDGWPREKVIGKATYTVYQPQIETWDGYEMRGYAAFSVKDSEEDSPTFGVVWISAITLVDKDNRLVVLNGLNATRVAFPSAPEREERYLQAVRDYLLDRTRVVALDRLEAEMAVIEAEKRARTFELKNDPPRILFSDSPALLIYVDGDPAYRSFEDTQVERVINANVLLLRNKSGTHYLHLFDGWMTAEDLDGPWRIAEQTPGDLEKAERWARETGRVDLMEVEAGPEDLDDSESAAKKFTLAEGPVPKIIVSTVPTELIVTEGKPKYEPLENTNLLYVENTTGHLFQHTIEQKNYVLISGRWFRSDELEGPWEYIPGGKLPVDFNLIPDDSPKENVKAAVPGTPQAQEAVIAASIPQTAEVKLSEAELAPLQFDGEPQLRSIEGTTLQYVPNSPTPIILAENRYYAVQDGIWFVAVQLDGPWQVATSVPAEIYSIPPSSALHYVTYVKIYGSNDEIVRVGYTPGYNGTVITTGSGAIVVYGTGFHYRPWVGAYWYGPPVTYGFGVSLTYTPWTGWCFGFGFGWYWGPARVTVGWGWGPYPWWGPVGWGRYYPHYRPYGGYAWGPRGAAAWGPGGWAATTGNVYHRWGSKAAVTRSSGGYNAWTGNRWARDVGMSYNSRNGNLAAGQRAAVGNVYTGDYAYGKRGTVTNTRSGVTASGGKATIGNARTGNSVTGGRAEITNPNTGRTGSVGAIKGEQGGVTRIGDDVFGTKDGNVYRRGDSGWEQMERSGQWQGTQDRARTQSLDRQRQGRTQGSQRYQNYRSGGYRSAGGAGRTRGRRR